MLSSLLLFRSLPGRMSKRTKSGDDTTPSGRLAGLVALVTGAGGAIGEACGRACMRAHAPCRGVEH